MRHVGERAQFRRNCRVFFAIMGIALHGALAETPTVPASPEAALAHGELAPERQRWRDFDVYALYADQTDIGSSRSFGIDWRPELWGEGNWKCFGTISAGLVYGQRRSYPATTLGLRLSAARQFDNFYYALGGGTESWLGFGGTALALDAEVGYLLSSAHLTRLYVAYLPIFFTVFTSELTLGVGLNF